MNRKMVCLVLVLVFLQAGCVARYWDLTPQEWDSLKIRRVERSQAEVWQAAVSMLNQAGFIIFQADPVSGVIITDWHMVEGEIGWRYVLSGQFAWVKVLISIREISPTASEMTLQISACSTFGSARPNESSSQVEVNPQDYDDFYAALGRWLGTVFSS